MMLGLKGAFSVMESSAIRQRAFEAKLAKAARGELFALIAVGYVLGANGRLEKDPNERTREAVNLVFSKFRELGSVRQVVLWLRQENVCLPKLTPLINQSTPPLYALRAIDAESTPASKESDRCERSCRG